MTTIIGAGLAGLIAASTAFQDSPIIEMQDRNSIKKHLGVLRFRTPQIGLQLGIPFKQVTVQKSIYSEGTHHDKCNIKMGNDYSKKVIGSISNRSIWNLETANRYIAPDNFHEILLDRCNSRIEYGVKIDYFCDHYHQPTISTMPMPMAIRLCDSDTDIDFSIKKIRVSEVEIPFCNVYQTIYFPDEFCEFPDDNFESSVYRATINGNKLIIESIRNVPPTAAEIATVLRAFGLDHLNNSIFLNKIENGWKLSKQNKIKTLVGEDEQKRRMIISKLTSNYNDYSLGRFATWRNILLDDVLNDIYQIKKLIESDSYTKRLAI